MLQLVKIAVESVFSKCCYVQGYVVTTVNKNDVFVYTKHVNFIARQSKWRCKYMHAFMNIHLTPWQGRHTGSHFVSTLVSIEGDPSWKEVVSWLLHKRRRRMDSAGRRVLQGRRERSAWASCNIMGKSITSLANLVTMYAWRWFTMFTVLSLCQWLCA